MHDFYKIDLCLAIYRYVSQKQISDIRDEDGSPHNNVQSIQIASTETSDAKKGCC